MAKEQEKEKKDTPKGQAADPKAKKKPGRPAKRKSSADAKAKAEAQDEPGTGSEQNAQVNQEAASESAGDSPETTKPGKKKGRPKKKPAKKEATPQAEKAPAATADTKKDPANPEAGAPKENTEAPKEGLAGNVPEASDQEAKTEQGAPRAAKKSRSRKKSGSRKKGGPKSASEAVKPEEPLEGAQENAPEHTETPEQETAAPEMSNAEATAQPTEEVKPRKKKSRKKKSKKKAEAATPPPVEEPAPVVIQENKVVIASKNPAKIKAVELAYGRMFPGVEFIFDSVSVPSGVSDQPMSDDETFAGALFRAQLAQQEVQDAGYYIGLEGGLEEIGEELHAFAWMVVLGQNGMMGKARTSTFVLPYAVAELIRDGKELGEADDIVFGETNSKQGLGAVGILTHGLIDRAQYYSEAVVMALIPFKNPEHYPVETIEKVIV